MATAGVAEEVAEAAETVAEEAAEFAEKARGFSSREITLFATGVFWGTACGCVAGYFWTKGRLETKYQQLADAEIAEMRRWREENTTEVTTHSEDKPELSQVVKELGYKDDQRIAYDKVEQEPPMEPQQEEEAPRNVFEIPQPTQEELEPDWDYATEVKNRTNEDPFIIHRDEWNEGESNFDQISLTYFEGDDTLANERDKVIEDQDKVIGLGNMLKWGHGSGDPNVIYVRNPVLALDIEVTRSLGTYASEVHGLQEEDELQHSSHRIRPRKRFDDGERS
jgi:hypothetical protein